MKSPRQSLVYSLVTTATKMGSGILFLSTRYERILLGVLLLLFSLLMARYINADFWNDEIYTFKHFVFVPLETTLSDYHVPNNHVFFNLLNSAYLTCLGYDNLHQLMDHPWVIRLPYFLVGLASLVLVFKICKKWFNSWVALLAVGLLITTVPYTNFVLQMRGYGLSMFLILLAIYGVVRYLESQHWKWLPGIAITVAFSIYTIPLNIYIVCGMLTAIGCFFMLRFRFGEKVSLPFWALPVSGLSILAGAGISLLLYLPVFEQVFFNKYVKSFRFFDFGTLAKLKAVGDFFSFRSIFVVLAAIGLCSLLIRKRQTRTLAYAFVAFILLITPFMICWIRGDHAPLRAFSNLTPYFAILLSVLLYHAFITAAGWKSMGLPFFILMAISLLTYHHTITKIDAHLWQDIQTRDRSQGLMENYYQGPHFRPLEVAREFKEKHYTKNTLIFIESCEPHGFNNYMDKFGMTYERIEKIDTVFRIGLDSFYVVTCHPHYFQASIMPKAKGYKAIFAGNSAEASYNNFMRVVRNQNNR